MVKRIATNAGTPLYAAAFVGNEALVVGGGGGQGAHGVANKLVAFRIEGDKLAQTDELPLPPRSDAPTSMAAAAAAAAGSAVWVGANVPRATGGGHDHLARVALGADGKLAAKEYLDLFGAADVSTYQRATSVAGNTVAAASSASPGVVAVHSAADGDRVTMRFADELVGAAIADYDSKYQKYVAAASEARVEVRALSSPAAAAASLAAPPGAKWSRIAALGPGRFVAAATTGARAGATLAVVRVGLADAPQNGDKPAEQAPVLEAVTVPIPGFRGVTALAASGTRAAVASPGGDVVLFDVGSEARPPRVVARLRRVHTFPVTALALSPDGTAVVSTSLDGSLVVHTGLGLSAASVRATVGWVTLSALLIALIALALSHFLRLDALQSPAPGGVGSSGKFLSVSLTRGHAMGHGPVVQRSLTLSTREEHDGGAAETAAVPVYGA